jgi:hypothetical protein
MEQSGSVWAHLAGELAAAGCAAVFGVPADEPGLLDAADEHPALAAVTVRDQRTGACAAAGYALTSGNPVALAVSGGPSFLNSLAGVAEAASVGAPVVLVTNVIPAAGIQRGGFQEVDQSAVAAPLVGWRYRVQRPDMLGWAARRAVRLAAAQLPSVCLLEITDEVLRAPSAPPAHMPGAAGRPPIPRLRGHDPAFHHKPRGRGIHQQRSRENHQARQSPAAQLRRLLAHPRRPCPVRHCRVLHVHRRQMGHRQARGPAPALHQHALAPASPHTRCRGRRVNQLRCAADLPTARTHPG